MTRHRTALAVSIAAIVLAASAAAQTPPAPLTPSAPPAPLVPPAPPAARPDMPPRPDAGAEATFSGRVARWLPNPNGEVDGLLLADGTQVAFPPHLGTAVAAAMKPQDAVEITGRRAAGGKLVQATALRNTTSGKTVRDEPGAGGRPPAAVPPAPPVPPGARPGAQPPAAGTLTAMNASGRIETVLYTGRGDANGVVMQDGTVVRFPPHAGAAVAAGLKPGAGFYARGYGTRGAQGNALEATALGTDAETARDVFAPPRPLPR